MTEPVTDEAERVVVRVGQSRYECQANRYNAATYCHVCNRHIGEGCGKYGPYAEVKP